MRGKSQGVKARLIGGRRPLRAPVGTKIVAKSFLFNKIGFCLPLAIGVRKRHGRLQECAVPGETQRSGPPIPVLICTTGMSCLRARSGTLGGSHATA